MLDDGSVVTGWDLADGPSETVISLPELKLRLDSEFRALCPPLQPDERERLVESIKREGIRDAVQVWPQQNLKGVALVLDGHNRVTIATELGVSFEYDVVEGLKTREDAKRWVIENQLGRRNLSPAQASVLRGQLYEQVKQPHGGDRRSKARKQPSKPAAAEVAERTGVTPATVKADARFARAVNKLASDDPGNRQRILSPKAGERKITKGSVVAIAEQPDPDLRKEMFDSASKPKQNKMVPAALAGRLSALLAHKQLLDRDAAEVARSVAEDDRDAVISKVVILRNWLNVLESELMT